MNGGVRAAVLVLGCYSGSLQSPVGRALPIAGAARPLVAGLVERDTRITAGFALARRVPLDHDLPALSA